MLFAAAQNENLHHEKDRRAQLRKSTSFSSTLFCNRIIEKSATALPTAKLAVFLIALLLRSNRVPLQNQNECALQQF